MASLGDHIDAPWARWEVSQDKVFLPTPVMDVLLFFLFLLEEARLISSEFRAHTEKICLSLPRISSAALRVLPQRIPSASLLRPFLSRASGTTLIPEDGNYGMGTSQTIMLVLLLSPPN